MKKAQVNRYPQGTFEHIVLHAAWQESRGRRPSATTSWERNPAKALAFAKRHAYFPKSGTYLNGQVPEDYKCSDCGRENVKLWRGYNDCSPKLLCAICAAKVGKKSIVGIDADGRHESEHGMKTDSIGWYVPAVPCEELDTFWGYTSVPSPGVAWWRKLPTLLIKSGHMPNTDFYYEEFEGMLASYYMTLLCLKDREGEDGQVFQTALEVLNGFAERHFVRFPADAAKQSRPTKESWGQPKAFDSCFTLYDMMGSFWRDFGVGADPKTEDGIERFRLGRCLIMLLHRHGAIEAKFQEHEGAQVPVGIKEMKPDLWKSLESVLVN